MARSPSDTDQRKAAYRDERERLPSDVAVYANEVFDGYPKLYVHVCPYCRQRYNGPGGHHMAGDDSATSCFHRRPGERGVVQPRLVRIEVVPVEEFTPLPIPVDTVPPAQHVAAGGRRMTVLRPYDPKGCLCGCGGECDEHGVPLDWESCRRCEGTGGASLYGPDEGCVRCGGHGSLKAAALALLSSGAWRVGRKVPVNVYRENEIVGPVRPTTAAAALVARLPLDPARCEDCGHPMSEGTWEGEFGDAEDRAGAAIDLSIGRWLEHHGTVHYSSCDEGCRHGGPRRADAGLLETEWVYKNPDESDIKWVAGPAIEASWRQVDVRTLGWPMDLRPERLAVLCLRCFAERSRA